MASHRGRLLGHPGTLLREILAHQAIMLPGAHDAITAKLAERVGFKAIYLSGAAVANAQFGFPDVGLTTLTEVGDAARRLCRSTTLPVLVDVDTGFGDVSSLHRTVQEMERAGAAGIQMEDQEFPKRCGHLSGKKIIPVGSMQAKVRAACQARRNPDFLIVARSDARALEGIPGVIGRLKLYRESGADLLFPEALQSRNEFGQVAQNLGGWLVANMTEFGKTPIISFQEFKRLGYRVVLYPLSVLRVTLKSMDQALRQLRAQGTQRNFVKNMMTRKRLYSLLQYNHRRA